MSKSAWMAISGAAGFGFFLIANLSDFFVGLSLTAGLIQVVLNVFVFFTWLRGYRDSAGLRKFVAFFGVVIPPVLASITLYRVIIPGLL